MSVIFYSDDMKKEIEKITRKNINDISEKNLSEIKTLSLNKKDFSNGTDRDYNMTDLNNFPNLEIITLSGFKLDKNDIIVLNLLPKIKFLHFDFCDFEFNEIHFNSNLEHIVINHCNNLSIKLFDFNNAKTLKFINSKAEKKIINIEDFKLNNNLKELSINNYKVSNIEKVLQVAPNLIKLNLDGSEILDEKNLDFLKIKVSHEQVFNRLDS